MYRPANMTPSVLILVYNLSSRAIWNTDELLVLELISLLQRALATSCVTAATLGTGAFGGVDLVRKRDSCVRLWCGHRSMFEHVATLGTGAFGEVDLVRKRDSCVLFALKTLRKRDVLQRNQVAHVKAERDILAEADNEWVVKLYYSFQVTSLRSHFLCLSVCHSVWSWCTFCHSSIVSVCCHVLMHWFN